MNPVMRPRLVTRAVVATISAVAVRRRAQPERVGLQHQVDGVTGACVEDGADRTPAAAIVMSKSIVMGESVFCLIGHVSGAVAADAAQRHALGDLDLAVGVDARERAGDACRLTRFDADRPRVAVHGPPPFALESAMPAIQSSVPMSAPINPEGDIDGEPDAFGLSP